MTLVPIDTTSAVAVSDYLTRARDWLSTAVEMTGPEQIAAAKAEIATAAEASKQLGLSKEIQDDAREMVRRAEYALRKAVTKAQAAGEVGVRGDSLIPGGPAGKPARPTSSDKPSPVSFFGGKDEYEDANAMAALTSDEFNEVIDAAKAEGNLSRANVARKAREKSAPEPAPAGTTERRHQEAELINSFGAIVRRAITRKHVATLSPKAKERLISILEQAIQTLKENDQ